MLLDQSIETWICWLEEGFCTGFVSNNLQRRSYPPYVTRVSDVFGIIRDGRREIESILRDFRLCGD